MISTLYLHPICGIVVKKEVIPLSYGNTEVFLSPSARESLIQTYLGKSVDILIDRPIGFIHHTKGITLHYSINYGYLPGVMGGDGEDQDVYILGVDEPLERFTGRIIGVIRRKDDNEDKFVAAPEGMDFHQGQIAEAVHFVEKYFDSKVDALVRRSCGVIPYQKTPEGIRYLVLLQTNGFWSFPKGHIEPFETEENAALRELQEETGLSARLIPGFREMASYPMPSGRIKQVVLFAGQISGDIQLQRSEATDFRWVTAEEAKLLLHPDFSEIIGRVQQFLEA